MADRHAYQSECKKERQRRRSSVSHATTFHVGLSEFPVKPPGVKNESLDSIVGDASRLNNLSDNTGGITHHQEHYGVLRRLSPSKTSARMVCIGRFRFGDTRDVSRLIDTKARQFYRLNLGRGFSCAAWFCSALFSPAPLC
jgi:hypothetical protein